MERLSVQSIGGGRGIRHTNDSYFPASPLFSRKYPYLKGLSAISYLLMSQIVLYFLAQSVG